MRDDTDIRNGAIKDEQREEELIDAVIEAALSEIVAVVLEGRVARVFCNLWYVVHHYSNNSPGHISVEGDYTAVREGIRGAADDFANNREKPVSEYIKYSIAVDFVRLRDKHIAAVHKKRPEELLHMVLSWRRPNAAVLLEHLTFEQRDRLLELLFARRPIVGRAVERRARRRTAVADMVHGRAASAGSEIERGTTEEK